MKKILFAIIALFTIGASAQKLDKSLLWKISGNGIKQPSYLFGTMHITCDATLDKNVLTALDSTRQLYLEMDMDDPALKSEMMKDMIMKDGKKISTMVKEEDFAVLDTFFKKELGVSVKLMDNLKPALISMSLIAKMIDCPMQSFEEELMKITHEQKEEVYGLETIEEQMAIFDQVPYEIQVKELVKTAKDNMEHDKVEFQKVMEVYNSKDLNEIMRAMNESENKIYGDNNDILLTNRNKNWIPKIEEIAKTTPTFFAVGAAHLGGKEGIIMLLRKKGYTVEAVN